MSRIVSFCLQTRPEQLHRFSDPLNYLLTLGAILLLLRATGTASASVKKLRTGKKLLASIQVILVIELFYLLAAQVLHFTMNINIHNSPFVIAAATIISLPSVCGLYALYFSKQLRSKIQYLVSGLFFLAVLWNILRIAEKVLLPLLAQHTAISEQALKILYSVAGVNDILSLALFIAAFILLSVYAYFCGKAARKMPEKND
ncbi:MAG: hypothetical protein E7523_12460 [Ruminococcaceae bacterium]|nr:hypothetical protein [Oscillospiraceae bacterium]